MLVPRLFNSNSMDISEVLRKQKRVIELLDDAENIRSRLVDYIQLHSPLVSGNENLSSISTAQNTAPTSPIVNNVKEELSSFTDTSQYDINSPLASTIHLLRSTRRSRQRSFEAISSELRSILTTVSSYVHRRALIAIDRYGYHTVKWTRGFTALHWAWKVNRIDIVEYLLRKGADANARDDRGRLPIDHRPQLENKIVESIRLSDMVDLSTLPISQKACLEVVESRGWNALKWAGGWTILHWAYQEGRRDVIEYLQKIGVPDNLRDAEGRTPSEYARIAFSVN